MNMMKSVIAWGACALITAPMFSGAAAAQAAREFASPEDAVQALVAAVKAGHVADLLVILGSEGRDLIESSDPAAARRNREVFTVAAREQWHLEDAAPDQKTLVIGNEHWPFPVPIVKEQSRWRFDTAAGKEEVIARRIGRNELAAIAAAHAYVTAQRRYAQAAHDGNPAGAYAMKFASDPGKENGLYWPVKTGQKRSPLGDLVAQAAAEGRAVAYDRPAASPFHGYYFKILTAQGSAVREGRKPYVIKGLMTGGFALVAWPAQYDVTGVMTFVVSHEGVVHEKDLGPGTDAAARQITVYNPDASWASVR
jgi:hypothetical protein